MRRLTRGGAAVRAGLVAVLTASVLAPGGSAGVAAQTTTTAALALPTIALSFTDGQSTPITSISEQSEHGDRIRQVVRVVATASAAVSEEVSVSVTVGAEGGTADKGQRRWKGDFQRLGNDYQTAADSVTVTIAAGAASGSSGDIAIIPWDDHLVEGDETIRFTAGAVSGYQAIPAADLVLEDFEDNEIILRVSPATVVEGTSETVTVTAEFRRAGWSVLTAAVDVTLTVASGGGSDAATLGPNGDFTTDAKGNQVTLTIPAGAVSGSAVFTLTAAADTDNDEYIEKGKITGTASVGGSAVDVYGAAIGIIDAGFGVRLTIDADADAPGIQSSLGEDAGKVTVRITAALASGTAPSGGLTIGLRANGVGARGRLNGNARNRYRGPSSFKAGDDIWIIYPSGQSPLRRYPDYGLGIRIPHNKSSGSAEMTVVMNDDQVAEDVEVLRFVGRVRGDVYKVVDAQISLTDNDGGSGEGGSGGGTPPSGGGGSGAQALPTIALSFTDGQSRPITSISESNSGLNGRQVVRVVAASSSASSAAVSVPVTVGAEGGTADKGGRWQSDVDYSTTADSVTVTIAAGATSGSSDDIEIFVLDEEWDDYLVEGDETIRFTAGAVSGYQAIPAADLVLDDFEDDVIMLHTVNPATVVEGTSETVTVTAGFLGAGRSVLTAATDVTLTVASGDGSDAATLGPNGDFTTDAKGNQVTLTIPAGAVDGSVAFTLTAVADTDNDEYIEKGKITGTASVGGSAVDVYGAVIGIVNADFGVHLIIDADADAPGIQSSLGEDAGEVTVRVTAALASGTAPSGGLTIGLNANAITARERLNESFVRYEGPSSFKAGDDIWIIYPSGQSPPPLRGYHLAIVIPHNESSGSAEMTVVLNDDRVAEGVEVLRFDGRVRGDIYKVVDAQISIVDNDGAPELPAPVCTVEPCGGAPAGAGGGSSGGPTPPSTGGGGGVPSPSGGGGGAPLSGGGAPEAPPAPVCEGRFCDEDGSVHQANTERIAQWQITLGCSSTDATLFCPGAEITRRQMAAFLYRAVSQRRTIPTPPSAELTDVAADAWFRTYADWVISIGAFAAPEGVFNPGGVVTRADMAVMMIAAFPHLEAAAEPEGLFQDAQGADPAAVRAIEGMYKSGVTRGCSTDPLNYCPDQPVTRAQMASFFVRAIELTPAP